MTLDTRRVAVVLGAIAVVVVGYALLDLAIVSDEERLEELVDAVRGTVEPGGIARALEWADPAVEPVQVDAYGRTHLYEDPDELRREAHGALGRFQGDTLRVLSQTIEVEEDRARLSLRIVGSQGMHDVDLALRRHGDRWLVSEVSVRR